MWYISQVILSDNFSLQEHGIYQTKGRAAEVRKKMRIVIRAKRYLCIVSRHWNLTGTNSPPFGGMVGFGVSADLVRAR